jgi:biopolymer transport protein ExbB
MCHAGGSLGRKMPWLVLAAVVLTAWSAGWLLPVQAAEEGAAPAAEAAPAEGGAAPGSDGQSKEQAKEKPWLIWFLESSGMIGLFILLLSIYFVATVCRQFWELRLEVAVPPDLVSRAQELLQQKNFKAIFDLVKEDDSFFGRLVAVGIGELPNGLAEARDVMERTAESFTVEMEKRISILAVLGTLGPMIGLLGTLKGMIGSFGVIARSDVQMKASEVAGGISEALLLTFEGVALSVPAIYFFSLFRNRVSTISTSAALEADQFVRHFAHAARANRPAAGAAAAKTVTKVE